MELTQAQIRKFQTLYKEQFSVELSDEDAIEKGSALVMLLKQVYKPLPKDEYENKNEQTRPAKNL